MSSQPPAATLIPVIHTERLILRAHTPNDFLTSAALWADSNVTHFIGGRPLSEEEVWARLLRYAGHWSWMGFGYWVIEEKLTGAFVGEMGFADWKRDIEPSLQGVPELGWVLAADFHGKGFATEVVRAALAWSDRKFRGQPTMCIIHPDNGASIRVAEKCGYKETLRTMYHGHQTIVYRRLCDAPSALKFFNLTPANSP
jgi:RimJ/RimL family protein N-acetyltransferase